MFDDIWANGRYKARRRNSMSNNVKEYGGYLPIELPFWNKEYFAGVPEKDIVRLNCGRSAF